jgi:hypothetical protein
MAKGNGQQKRRIDWRLDDGGISNPSEQRVFRVTLYINPNKNMKRMSMVLGPQIVTPDPTPGWFTANWEAASKPQLEWLAVNGGYMQKIIAGRYLRDWAKDHPGV